MLRVGGMKFRDEGHAVSYLLKIRETYPCNKMITDESHHDFLMLLIKRHPSWPLKFISTVKRFATGRFRTRQERGFMWCDENGNRLPFSFRLCLRHRDPSPQDLKDALGIASIKAQHQVFLKGRGHCDQCRRETKKLLAGYLKPRTFISLWAGYRGQALLDDWIYYHRHEAVLRALCASCYYGFEENKP